jgi:RNA polymerase sigma-70 factor, ECF subfamily
MTKPIPPETITRAMQGDWHAFRQIVETHQSFAYAVAFRLVGNKMEAEDITQEAFIRLWKNIPNYKREIKLSTWLYKIIMNLCLDYLRSPRNRQTRLHDDLDRANAMCSTLSPEDALHDRELHLQIEKATETLSPIQKAIFVLRDLEALSVEETCLVLSTTPKNVKSNLFHARKKIFEKLQHVYQSHQQKKACGAKK